MVQSNIIVLCVILAVAYTLAQTCGDCLYTDKLWGDVNPNVYHFCNPASNTSVEESCPTGHGFIKNGTAYGCVPYSDWPDACVAKGLTIPNCTDVSATQPTATSNPNQYYLCPDEGDAAVLLSCNTGLGFVSGTSGCLGCVAWSEWRTLQNCPV